MSSMKKDYMTRLERAARWRLQPQEAEDVIADYRDIVGTPPRPEEQLRREVGDPEQVVKMLVAPPKAYYTWLVVFAALTFCLLAAALAPLPASPSFRLSLWYEWFSGYRLSDPEFSILCFLPLFQLAAGMVLCLVWFLRRREAVNHPRSKWMLPCALLLAVIMAYAWSVVWRISANPEQYLTTWVEDTSIIGEGIGPAYTAHSSPGLLSMAGWLEWGGCALSGLVGTVALVKARTQDRRWAAIYLLALTAAVLSLAVLAMLNNFSDLIPYYQENAYYDGWLTPYLPQFAAVTAVGLVGTGVALK